MENLNHNVTQPTKVAVIKGSYTDKHGNVTTYMHSIYSNDSIGYIKRLCSLERNAHPNVEQTIEWFDKTFLKKILRFVEKVVIIDKTYYPNHPKVVQIIRQKAYTDNKDPDILWYKGPYDLNCWTYIDNYKEIDLIEFKKIDYITSQKELT